MVICLSGKDIWKEEISMLYFLGLSDPILALFTLYH